MVWILVLLVESKNEWLAKANQITTNLSYPNACRCHPNQWYEWMMFCTSSRIKQWVVIHLSVHDVYLSNNKEFHITYLPFYFRLLLLLYVWQWVEAQKVYTVYLDSYSTKSQKNRFPWSSPCWNWRMQLESLS